MLVGICFVHCSTLAHNIDNRIQTDAISFSISKKAFDKVPHHRLYKLKYYGISPQALNWVHSFLTNPTQHSWRAICLPPSTSPQESPKEVFSALSSSLSTLMTSLTIFKTIQLLNFLPTTPSSTTPSTTNKTLALQEDLDSLASTAVGVRLAHALPPTKMTNCGSAVCRSQ